MENGLTVALIGAGSMGGALLRGWLENGVIDLKRSAVFDPAPSPQMTAVIENTSISLNPPHDARTFDALVVAVKPQAARDVLPGFADLAHGAGVISVMAGKSVATIEKLTPRAGAVIRAMPNLPAAVGAGVTGLYAPPGASAHHRANAETLMRAVGDVVWVETEQAINAVTAVSGSGPAYFFLLGEALAEAANAAGFPPEIAERLARATLEGAGAFAAQDKRTLSELRKAVTSPGGTTEAALKILDGETRQLREIVKVAVNAAKARAADLTD